MGANLLTNKNGCGIIQVKDGWAICPSCQKKKLFPVLPTTVVRDLELKCNRCEAKVIVNIEAPEPESSKTSA